MNSAFWSGVAVGGAVGLAAGLSVRVWVDRMAKTHVPHAERDKRVRSVLLWLAVIVALTINVGSGSLAYSATKDTQSVAVATSHRDTCSTNVLVNFLEAINERTELNAAASEANTVRLHAQEDYLVGAAARDPDALTLFNNYLTALHEYLAITARQAATQIQFPYPTVGQIEACLP